MSIRQLPKNVSDKLRSSVTITSLEDVIIGLLKNALDASAGKIHITVDCAKGDCVVEDDGHGIPPEEFSENGGLAKPHHTSRFPRRFDKHGSRGEFLAALANLSLLAIASKHKSHLSHNSLLIHHRRLLARHCPARPEQRLHTFDHGTRITVRDLFGSMPVRLKQRHLTGLQRSFVSRGWSQIRLCVTSLLLAWPSRVTVVLREGSHGYGIRLQNDTSLEFTTRVPQLLQQADLLQSESPGQWIPVSATSRHMTVSGCFSTSPAPSRSAQLISIGLQPVRNTHRYNILFEEINKIFKASGFCADPRGDPAKGTQQAVELVIKSRKAADRWPVFYLQFRALESTEHNSPASSGDSQSLDVIVDLIRAVSHGFLKGQKYEFVRSLRQIDGAKAVPVGPPSLRQTSRPPMTPPKSNAQKAFDSWSRVKVGVPSRKRQLQESEPRSAKQRLVGNGGLILGRPFPEPSLRSHELKTDSSRGCQTSLHTSSPANVLEIPGNDPVQSQAKRPTPLATRTTRSSIKNEGESDWIHDISRAWENPVFEVAQSSIPCLHSNSSVANNERSHHWRQSSDHEAPFETGSVGIYQKISKHSLLAAEIISQVDQKFVLMKVPTAGLTLRDVYRPTTLVLLDQHAADERCRLEELMSSYFRQDDGGAFVAVLEMLEKPLFFDLDRQETELYREHRQHFESWGIAYTVKDACRTDEPAAAVGLLRVTALPPSIIERCRTEPRLLINLLRDEVWRMDDDGPSVRAGLFYGDASSYPWLHLFRDCPLGILELLQSRSCRSAIMFNDILDVYECKALVERLGQCAFPFQCAHGRPSLAPVLDLGSGPRIGAWTDEDPAEKGIAMWNDYMT